jgi:hypothetical protein
MPTWFTGNLRVITEMVRLDNVQYTATARWRAEIAVSLLGRLLSLLDQRPLRTVFVA